MMNATLDSPLIEMPGDPALSVLRKGAPQELRPQASPRLAFKVKDCGPLSLRHASTEDAAQIHGLVQALLSARNADLRVLAFVSTRDTGGSRAIGLRVAECLARQEGFRVCAIDADTNSEHRSRADWSLEDTHMAHNGITSAPPGSAGELWLLNASGTTALMAPPPGAKSPREQLLDLHSSFDYTIFSAPAIHSNKSLPILNEFEGVVLVVEAGEVRRQALENATRVLGAGNARLLGTVLTGRVLPIPERLFRWLRL